MKKWKKYLIGSIVFIVIAFFAFLIQYAIYSKTYEFSWETVGLSFLGNSLQVSGVLSIASGLLYFTASEGSFDGIVFATKQFYTALFKKSKYPYTYSEYKILKHPADEGKPYIWHFIIIGFVLIALGFVVYYI